MEVGGDGSATGGGVFEWRESFPSPRSVNQLKRSGKCGEEVEFTPSFIFTLLSQSRFIESEK